MLWYEITAAAPAAQVEAVAAVMRDVAPGGVSVEEPVEALGPERGFRVREGEPVLVRAYLPASELGAVLVDQLRQAMAAFPQVELVARPLYDQDWTVSWREFFGAVECGGRLVVVPSWVEYPERPGQLVLRVDPGQAFGTGHHETTRLCLAALEEAVTPGIQVLDVGTGSGILAIAAVKLGARHVDALDVDPVAVEVARANCAANGASQAVAVSAGTLTADSARTYGLVVANISAAANIGLAPAFAAAVAPGGRLILSGMLSTDARRVAEAMAAHGYGLRAVRHEHDWCLVELGRDGT